MTRDKDQIDEATSRWHIDKRINIATIISVGGLAATIMWTAHNLDKELALNTQIDGQQTEAIVKLEEAIAKLDDRLDEVSHRKSPYFYHWEDTRE